MVLSDSAGRRRYFTVTSPAGFSPNLQNQIRLALGGKELVNPVRVIKNRGHAVLVIRVQRKKTATAAPLAPGPSMSGILVVALANVPPFSANLGSSALPKLSFWYFKAKREHIGNNIPAAGKIQ